MSGSGVSRAIISRISCKTILCNNCKIRGLSDTWVSAVIHHYAQCKSMQSSSVISMHSYLIVSTWASTSIFSHQSMRQSITHVIATLLRLEPLPRVITLANAPPPVAWRGRGVASAATPNSGRPRQARWAPATTWRGRGGFEVRTWDSSDFRSEFIQTDSPVSPRNPARRELIGWS